MAFRLQTIHCLAGEPLLGVAPSIHVSLEDDNFSSVNFKLNGDVDTLRAMPIAEQEKLALAQQSTR